MNDDEKRRHPEGHGLDSAPTEDAGEDVSGAGYVDDESLKHGRGEGLASPSDPEGDGADVSGEGYVDVDHGDHAHRDDHTR